MPSALNLIRLATLQDLEEVATLEQTWVLEEPVVGFEVSGVEGLSNYISEVDKSMWVAEFHNDIVGYVASTIHRSSELAVVPRGEPYVEIDDLYVSQTYRSESLGSRLVETVLDYARDQKIEYSYVFSASSMVVDIMRFYQNQGFQPWGVQFFRRI